MQWLSQWRRQARPPAPAFADAIVQLATFATGDGPSALELARVALHRAPSLGYAVTNLDNILPSHWLSWPSVGPREWLELDLRATDAERLVAVLGEWSPRDRLLLGVWLLLDVPAEDLEQWLHFPGGKARVMTLLRHVARTLGWIEPVNRVVTCLAVMDSLIEADDQQAGRQTRLHLLGCYSCQEERTALQHARSLILKAWRLMFRAPRFYGQTVAQTPAQRERNQWLLRRAVGLAVCCVVGFATVRASAQTPVPPEAAPTHITAQSVIERVLHRWEQGNGTGVAHERYRILSGGQTLVIERWYDWSIEHRLRVMVHAMDGSLRLDLVTDGQHHLSYTVETPPFVGRTMSIDSPGVAQLLPLLRQLPVVGPLGSFPGDLHNADLALVRSAQQARPRLLGTSRVGGRLAIHLLYTDADHVAVHLLIDQQTAAVLRATRLDPETGQSLVVWQADLLETVPWSNQLDDSAERYSPDLPDPRELLAPAPAALTVWTVLSREMPVAFPAALPGTPLGAFLHDQDVPSLAVEQVYEGEDWSLILKTWRLAAPQPPPATFVQHVGDIAYTIIPGGSRDTIAVEWQLGMIARGSLLFWHATLPRDRQVLTVRSILGSLTLLTPANAPEIQRRFLLPGSTEPHS
ncbi:MAG: hypothetical protein H0X37_05330 [Herpetosiphonaceae bacterium]|nr:hypothetical protein [Herpetosiphonaceae bacterium]